MKHAYGGSLSFRGVLVSLCSRIEHCFRVWHLACKEYWIKVFTSRFKLLLTVVLVNHCIEDGFHMMNNDWIGYPLRKVC